MNNETLNKVALRHRAIFLPVIKENIQMTAAPTVAVMAFVARLKENRFGVSETLLHALCQVPAERLADIARVVGQVMGADLNWAPLVKGWNVPTGETLADHIVTFWANIYGKEAGFKGTTLPCGHLIPEGTFPMERYNGCPFCGTPFATTQYVYKGQGSKLKTLQLYTESDLRHVLHTLLSSPTPLDATQRDSLALLIGEFGLPNVAIPMKETVMLAVKALVDAGKDNEAALLLRTPSDILRFLWMEKTGMVQIVEPKTLIARARQLYTHMFGPLDRSQLAGEQMKQKLKQKYDRRACRRVAGWMNALPMNARLAAENMNPKRGMWVRMIRALRLGEYAKKPGMEHLRQLLDVFYNQDYTTWQGQVDRVTRDNNAVETFRLLKQRPGLFARCLFSTMLRFGPEETQKAFEEVADQLPARLLLSLNNAAETWFDTTYERIARPIIGGVHRIEPHKLLALYDAKAINGMRNAVKEIYQKSMSHRFAAMPTTAKTIYIDPALYDIPVSVGDRSASVQDTSCALMGTRFAVEGNAVRLFLQWGKGLHKQHLDMDLSCAIAFADGTKKECAYYNLETVGAKHSGDIRAIPEMVGTAEYIELDINQLSQAGARYVTFTCNAYSVGSLCPNLVVGWMLSANPMTVSETDGVAYDPSCVQHMVRVSEENQNKALVFGVLEVEKREIVWLEMPFMGQNLRSCNLNDVRNLLCRLENKVKVGTLLRLKADAQHLTRVDSPDKADEAYTYHWALNPAEVSTLLNG